MIKLAKDERNYVGRPLQYKDATEMQKEIDKYYEMCEAKGKPLTVTGLANAIGLSRQGLLNYQNRDEFVDTIKKAKSKVEQYAEEYLFLGKNQAGAIFNLKNNHAQWVDRQEIQQTENTKIIIKRKDNDKEE